MASFAKGFDAVFHLQPQEIQVGILKRLKGAPIAMHTGEYGMRYSDLAPYEVLYTNDMTRGELDFIKQYASLWDLLPTWVSFAPYRYSHPIFPILGIFGMDSLVFQEKQVSYGHSLTKLEDEIYLYLTEDCAVSATHVATHLIRDRMRLSRSIPVGSKPSRQ